MLLDLRRALRSGEQEPVTLRFDHGEPMQIDFAIRSARSAARGRSYE